MIKSKAEIEQQAAEWMKAKGYDRRTWKDVSSIIADFVVDNYCKENKKNPSLDGYRGH